MLVAALQETAAGTSWLPGARSSMVDVVTVAGAMGSLKRAPTVIAASTPTAPLAGVRWMRTGGVESGPGSSVLKMTSTQ